MMLCAKYGLNWSSGSEEDQNEKSVQRRQQVKDDDGQQTNLVQKSSHEPSDPVS